MVYRISAKLRTVSYSYLFFAPLQCFHSYPMPQHS